jgi:DNA-binding ferritin-like protein
MENIILNLIKLQTQLRILHWQTGKYAEHKALGTAYEDLDGLIDELVEVYQGKRGKIKYPSPSSIELVNYEEISVMDILDEVTEYLSDNFTSLVNSDKDTDCLNIRDSILAVLNKLKYLLTLN